MSQSSSVQKNHRIAVVEDDSNLRDYFMEIITSAMEFDLAGSASTFTDARELFRLEPDLFLLDIGLPDGSGLDLIPLIKQRLSKAKILVVTSFGDRETVVSAISQGADGYLLKDSDPDEITDGIRTTLAGGAPISASAAAYLLEKLQSRSPAVVPAEQINDGLTPREIELLEFFARGLSYREAAECMGISPLSVGNYVKSIYSKLAVHSRSEAVFEALKTGQIHL